MRVERAGCGLGPVGFGGLGPDIYGQRFGVEEEREEEEVEGEGDGGQCHGGKL